MTHTELITLVTAIVGAVTGLLGAVLGIMNTWNQLSKNRVRLKIVPSHALPVGPVGVGEWTLSIGVINLSAFAVTIVEVGLKIRSTKQRLVAFPMATAEGKPLPQRLEPRESLTILYRPDNLHDPHFPNVNCAYARCACGTVRYGKSPALSQLVRKAKDRVA